MQAGRVFGKGDWALPSGDENTNGSDGYGFKRGRRGASPPISRHPEGRSGGHVFWQASGGSLPLVGGRPQRADRGLGVCSEQGYPRYFGAHHLPQGVAGSADAGVELREGFYALYRGGLHLFLLQLRTAKPVGFGSCKGQVDREDDRRRQCVFGPQRVFQGRHNVFGRDRV